MAFPLAFLALIIERALGYPDRLVRLIGHPVIWIGALISLLDRNFNRDSYSPARRRLLGFVALVVICLVPAFAAAMLMWLVGPTLLALVVTAFFASSLLAQKSLEDHVMAVAVALDENGLEAGRDAVARIVGRDPAALDEAGVARAAIESLAENFSDGVVAPAFWLGLLGLPGGAAYKAVNTADSMIGHRTDRHREFGYAAARFDDLINLPASRLTALLIVAAAALNRGTSARAAWRAVLRDAHLHRSPNAGWPEAAVAGALGLALAGPRAYGGKIVDDAVMGVGGRLDPDASDIGRALQLYRTADLLLIALFGALALLTWQF
ncbi:adenosylcobinamide-phosphate synthase CbiB [Mesorhizobium sp. Z1-4]|uniref:adenosylcobinamide-phosphate synthase CbiB n=1 Tax=Mesorhizobium sp. Z1-4 TaxID=2448478 RepID=UPI000FD80FCE|nr:adenosylcobinamide-phosphate synthase CbiB [Mesorhizobium sp. Z1-4]